jgi:hypothetical protein
LRRKRNFEGWDENFLKENNVLKLRITFAALAFLGRVL